MIDLKAQFGSVYRVTLDESAQIPGQTTEDRAWLQQIRGKFGHLYIHAIDKLGAYVRTRNDGSRRLPRLLEIPGVKLHQRGDDEASVILPLEAFDRVDEILQFRRRPRQSPEQRTAAAERIRRWKEGRPETPVENATVDA
jgi:hypothetical protein